MRHFSLSLVLFVSTCSLKAQVVTEIVTDFQGYWRSGIKPNVNGIAPNNSHNLLSFTLNGTRYSTGVNDGTLIANGLSFIPGSYKALPVSQLSAAPTNGSTYIGLGQMYDGVAGASTPPPANNIPFYLTDGANGLNLGTAVYNLPSSNLIFDIGLFNISRIGDGIPDIIVTQMGDIAAGVKDTLRFVDPAGNLVGNSLAVTFAGADTLGIIDNDFYNAWQNPMGFNTGFYPSNTKRAVRVFAFELSEFGLNGTNFGAIDKFIQKLSGQSDPAFVAYNTGAMTVLPNNNPGCFTTLPGLWLKADEATSTITNNVRVGAWQDRGPNSFSMDQQVIGNAPVYRDGTSGINFNPYLNFDAINRMIAPNSPFTAADNNVDFFIVGRPTSNAGVNKIIGFSRNAGDHTGTGAGDFPAINYTAAGRLSIDSGDVNLVTSTSARSNEVVLHQVNYTQGAGSNITIKTNGAIDGTTSVSRSLGRWTFQLGDMAPGDNGSDFDVAEIIVFPANLTADERLKIESYLSIKYGLPSSHDLINSAGNTVWSLTTNAGYSNNVFGIGREDCQALHQRQSKSLNANALVTIGNGGIAVDNASNFTLLGNGAFHLQGDNAASLALQSTEVPASCYQRIGREWKVRETGSVGSVFLRAPASTSPLSVKLPAASNGNMYLLVDNDGNFSSGVVAIVPMVLNGTNWEAPYNFNDGQYYTFATDNGINIDHNDLGTPWPAASSIINGCNTNADPAINSADFNSLRQVIWAGAGITSEASASSNAMANADGGDDGLQLPPVVSRYQNNVFTVLLNSNISTTVHYRLWIDWNADGNFGNDVDVNGNPSTYAGSDAVTGSAAKAVNINVLTPAGANSNFAIRLMVSSTAIPNNYASNANFIYALTSGEIEDYFFPVSVLPVSLRHFNATAISCGASIGWQTASETNSREYVVERSLDGTSFQVISVVPSRNEPNGASYQYTDNLPTGGLYYYRLKMVDVDGRFQYSPVSRVDVNCGTYDLTVLPNPVISRVEIRGLAGSETLTVVDMNGRVITNQRAMAANQSLNLESAPAGVYFLRVLKNNVVVHEQRLVKLP